MKFEEVLPSLREGKKITNGAVKSCGCKYIYYEDGTIFDGEGGYWHLTNKEIVELGDWEVLEEPRKIKLRDLSKRKYVNWWYRHCFEQNKCEVDCPLKNAKCDARFNSSWINHKDLYSDKFLDQEIEVEE